MAAVIGIVGPSGAGKTALVERRVAKLGARGLAVGCVKHVCRAVEADRGGEPIARYVVPRGAEPDRDYAGQGEVPRALRLPAATDWPPRYERAVLAALSEKIELIAPPAAARNDAHT